MSVNNMRSLMTIIIALLANIAMLVHAVVPHHHHNKVFAAVVNLLDETQEYASRNASYFGTKGIITANT